MMMINDEYTYQCDNCIHNTEDNYYTEFCVVCEEDHCILCTWRDGRICEDYEKVNI